MKWGTTYGYPLVIQFEDVDYQRVVHHPNYLKYFERARVDAIAAAGYSFSEMLHDGSGLVVADARIRYRSPLVFGIPAFVQSRLAAVASASFRLRQVLHDGSQERISAFESADIDDWDQLKPYAALADIVLVHVGTGEGTPSSQTSDQSTGQTRGQTRTAPHTGPEPFTARMLSMMGIQSIAERGSIDAAARTLLRSSKVRIT
jgi:YbgC/YbaW family acyl-CoA thioester hydrolase